MTAPTILEQIAEVKRELALRKNVYPAFVARGKMDQAEADQHLTRLSAACTSLEFLRDNRDLIHAAVADRKAK